MADWNEQAAPNNNIPADVIESSKLVSSNSKDTPLESTTNKKKITKNN
jgi:hypothetical protein